jgi:hypothetical protein
MKALGGMMRGIASLAFALLAGIQPAAARSFEDFGDDVMLYVRDGQSDRPSIVLYDPKAAEANVKAKRPVVELTLDFASATERWDYRAAVDDRLGELLKGMSARLVVTHTEPKQGRRSYLIVTAEPARVAAVLDRITPPTGIAAATRTLPASELETWRPTPLEFQDAQDEQVRSALAEQGDDGTTPRMVDFFFYGGDLAALRAAAIQMDFETRKAEGNRPGIVLSRRSSVDSKTLNTLNIQFLDWSSRFRVEYDGWETELARK